MIAGCCNKRCTQDSRAWGLLESSLEEMRMGLVESSIEDMRMGLIEGR